jgi:hypothetical protein
VVARLTDVSRSASHIFVPLLCRFGTLIAAHLQVRTEAPLESAADFA